MFALRQQGMQFLLQTLVLLRQLYESFCWLSDRKPTTRSKLTHNLQHSTLRVLAYVSGMPSHHCCLVG
jgi:hypothetical protein